MKKIAGCLLLISVLNLCGGKIYAQKRDPLWIGATHGIAWDSAHNAVLRSATIAFYMAKDSMLIGYRLTNNYGEFSYKGLPVNVPLKVMASFIGYKSTGKGFIIKQPKNELDIGHINLVFANRQLEEVAINYRPPPIRMNGDTLEFNADAFKLDPNAQTEDLLRILPGIVVWGDGTITVNGQEVKSVLVNGKPFLGKDARLATQNIPKNIVEKVQVYKNRNPKNLADSTTEMNIKLKKGKDVGYLGKFAGGYGTGNHYEGDGILNFFNSRSQLGLVLSANDVNKVANNMDVILANNTFKGYGASTDYQSDFSTPGLNKFAAGGLRFQEDFIPNPDWDHTNRLTTEYFIKNNKQDLEQNTETITTLNDGSYYRQQNTSSNTNTDINNHADVTYEEKSDGNRLSIDGNFNSENMNSTSDNKSVYYDEKNNPLSTSTILNSGINNTSDLKIKAGYQHARGPSWLSQYDLNYALEITDDKRNENDKTAYLAIGATGQDININRLYNNDSTTVSQVFTFKLPNFGALLFGDYKFAGIVTGLQNELEIKTNNVHDNVKDKDTLSNLYKDNINLTGNRQENDLNIKPALTFTKNIYKVLSNRYEKNFSAGINIREQFYELNSSSDKVFQQFSKPYQSFVPDASISYMTRQYGEFTNNIIFQIKTSSQYPTVQQLAPLVDNSNPNYVQIGNINLKPQYTRELTLSFDHLSERNADIFRWNLSLRAGAIDNYFANNSTIDTLRRTLYDNVNADGYKYINASGEIRKAFKWSNSQLQFSISPSASLIRSPNYINNVLTYFDNLSLSYNPSIYYTYKDWLAVNILEIQNYNHYSQKGLNVIGLSNSIEQSILSFSVNCTKKLSISSNINYKRNSYNGSEAQDFTMWNAEIHYRLFKDNKAEIKFAALDLLHQNTGLINYGSNNSITQGSVNTLQQYFMIGLAYYPRKFGK